MGSEQIRNELRIARETRETEMIAMDNVTYHYKRKYCIDCKFLNKKTYACKKNRVVKVCVTKYLKNKE